MIKFYKNEAGDVMYLDNTYLESDKFVIERPATDDDAVAHPDEHAAYVAATVPAPEPVAPVQPEPIAAEAAPISPDGAA